MIELQGFPKKKVLKFRSFLIKGYADVMHWGGGRGLVPMNSFRMTDGTDFNEVLEKSLNDGGFGVQSINGAIVEIYCDYSGYQELLQTGTVNDVLPEFWERYTEGEFD